VIIYVRSPEVIHTEAREFMTLVQRLTGRVNTHGDSSMPSSFPIQSQICHTSVLGNPNSYQVDNSPIPPDGGPGLGLGFDFLVKEDNSNVSGSNPSEFSGNIQSQYSTVQSLLSPSIQYGSIDISPSPRGGGLDFLVKEYNSIVSGSNPAQPSSAQSLLSPTIQYGSMSPLSPNFFLPSPRLFSPNIFHEFPLCTPQPDYLYSPYKHLLHMQSEPIFNPNAINALPSPPPTDSDLFNISSSDMGS